MPVRIPEKYRKLEVIDGLRGLAILAVLHHHLFWEYTKPGSLALDFSGLSIPLSGPLSNGWMGVNLFFFLSGFVLYLPYVCGTREFAGMQDVWQFYKRRFFRLMPLYYFVLLVSLTFFHFPRGITLNFWRDLLLMASTTFVFYPKQFFPDFNFLLWSLGVEVWFSLLFPLLMLGIRRFGLVRLGIFVFGFCLLARYYDIIWQPYKVGGFYLSFIRDNIFGRLDGFYAGMVACFAYVNFASLRPGLRRIMFLAGLALCALAFLAWDLMYLKRLSLLAAPLTNNLLDAGFCGLALALLFAPQTSLAKRIVSCTALRLLGIMCYSLYLWHGIVMQKLQHSELYTGQGVAIYLLLTFALSAMSYRYVEFRKVEDWRALFLLPWFAKK